MPVERIKVSTLINKVKQSNLIWQEKTKLSLFIKSAAEENYDNDGNLKNRVFKLDDYNKYKSIDIPSLEFALPEIMPKIKGKS